MTIEYLQSVDPTDIQAVIETPADSFTKYEIDVESGHLVAHRFLGGGEADLGGWTPAWQTRRTDDNARAHRGCRRPHPLPTLAQRPAPEGPSADFAR
jgi:hypothetical protein